jgi:hypothetical protein
MTLDEQIDLFFKKPHEPHPGGDASVLYLARQEAQNCLIGHLMPEDQAVMECAKDPQRVFASSMVILAAIDLLAKLYDGKDAPKEVAKRITAFAKDFVFTGLPSAETFAKVLYLGCRNPLLHSFAFENDTYTISVVTAFGRPGIVAQVLGGSPEHFVISVIGLIERSSRVQPLRRGSSKRRGSAGEVRSHVPEVREHPDVAGVHGAGAHGVAGRPASGCGARWVIVLSLASMISVGADRERWPRCCDLGPHGAECSAMGRS